MTAERGLVLVAAGAVALGALFVYRAVRTRWGKDVDRLDVDELGLELMTGCCAFVVFTTAACKPCKAALRIVRDAATSAPGLTEVAAVDAMQRADLVLRYDVRTVPTVFLITASGHVLKRWRSVPEPGEAVAALAAI